MRPSPGPVVGHANGRQRRLHIAGLQAVFPFVLLSGLLVTTTLAYAGPPDPTWIFGIYDDADCDDVIGLVIDGTGASSGHPSARIVEGLETYEVHLGPDHVSGRMLCAEMNRGPPRAEATILLSGRQSLRVIEVSPPYGGLCSRQYQRHGSPPMFRRAPPQILRLQSPVGVSWQTARFRPAQGGCP